MLDPLYFLILGIGFGFLHALEPDHLAGVATIASTTRDKKRAFRRGVIWGIGHTFTILVLYLLIQSLRLGIQETLFVKLESLVGFMLIMLGLRIWYKLLRDKYHFHHHQHEEGNSHLHLHSHKIENSHDHTHVPLGIGIVHGLAGSGAIILALTIEVHNQFVGTIHILLFGFGSSVAMGIFSGLIVGSIDKMGRLINNFDRMITTAVSIIATISCILGYGIMVDSGLF